MIVQPGNPSTLGGWGRQKIFNSSPVLDNSVRPSLKMKREDRLRYGAEGKDTVPLPVWGNGDLTPTHNKT